MPISGPKPIIESVKKSSGCNCGCDCMLGGKCQCFTADFGRKLMMTLLGVLLVYAIFYVGTLVRNNMKTFDYIGQADKMESTIYVMGVGKVSGNNDIAMTTIGFSNTDKDVAKAQVANKKVMDQIMAELKKMGVADQDMQTNYTINPDYEYIPDKGSVLKGYRVSNQLTVKIRDLGKITEILGLAGKYGATEVGGLSFTIDDPENLKTDARNKAVLDAERKAQELASKLGVKLGRLVSYNEYEAGAQDYYMMKSSVMGAEGGGGGVGPTAVATGSRDVTMNVNLTYAIVQR